MPDRDSVNAASSATGRSVVPAQATTTDCLQLSSSLVVVVSMSLSVPRRELAFTDIIRAVS